ncbi:MAG: exo-beta-N-acetylmuramidase NamZ family protein [Bacteroidales bacterium]
MILLLLHGMIQAQVRVGAQGTALYYPLLKGKHIGIVANQASLAGNKNIVDMLVSDGFDIVRIFSPEHGFRISGEAGQHIVDNIDSVTGIKVCSLYGKKMKPDSSDLQSIDLILFDLQDVGVRFYTYISTLTYMMEACSESGIPVVLLDRPNPNGFYVDGPVLEAGYTSFVGLHPVPVVYGMTIGEYAKMIDGEGWLKSTKKCDLRVIPLENYTHQTRYALPVKPSPNLPNSTAVNLYPSLCFFEGTNISVGRGTPFPFQAYGHPDLHYGSFSFTPESIPGISLHPPMEGKRCLGEDLRKYYSENPVGSDRIILAWLIKSYHAWKNKSNYFTGYFNKLAGNDTLQKQIKQGKSEKEIRKSWQPGIEKFMKIRAKYLLY